ncbi:nuclear pore complex protein NUP1 isoform X3 [Gastrolobium bilobum]|uniref:nuclear pore complex protein NUP1 isoform X3 n=1 Tax=Gastrolobium bilobum TaxID=150636 RepID=UPI002AB15547|nr:nuclear pore complex protein NUP1 isoform X3 [Gastrolobium bilobum]
MATARDENPYEGGGVFGKFRKRPFQRTQTTPYKRLLTALRNPSRNNGWFSKLVDPAQRLIASSANMLFASVFRKRLPPSPPPPRSSEAVQEARDNHQEAAVFYEEEQVANESSGKQQGIIVESGVQINCSDGGGLTELEKLLKQKTFTRSEIDHLTTLMRSRTVDPPVGEDGKRTEVVPSDPMLPRVQIEEYPKTPALENGIENHLVSTPYVTSSVSIDDVASPAELAKAYMGSRPSKVSQSMLGLRNPPREDPTLLRNQHFAQKSPVMSIVPRATTLARVRENGFVTPRSHGRSAIYRMARTPYARVYPISTLKGVGFVTPRSHGRSAIYRMARTPYARVYPTSTLKGVGVAVEGEPSSSAQYALDHDMLSGSKQRQALKRRSSIFYNDIGSFGPIRRIRHKSNLLSSKGLALPHSGAPLSIARNRVGIDAARQPSSSMQKPILLGEVKHSHTKLSAENVDDTMPSTSFPPISSKSSEMASKILQQLDNLVSPKEKSLEPRLPIMNDKSPTKLSSSMLRGQALRSMETVDSSKFLDNIQDNELDGTLGNLSASAQKLTSKIDKVENGPLKLAAPTDTDATVPRNQVVSIVKAGDSSVTNPVSYHPQKKRAFHMSAHEGVGFVTPRSHGRSAIYRMARTPYARVYPTSTLKGVGVAVEGEPSSSAQYALDHDMLSGSKQRALKRRSSLLDNDIGSFGPIRRMPHKSNLLSSKGLTLPHSGAPLSIARNRVGIDAAQQPSSSMQKPILLGEVKHSHTKLSAKNVDDTMPSTGFPPISSKSSEMASKILQQLDNLVSPKEKSLEPRLPIMNDKSPTKLSSSMLQGQALRSMETVDSSKFLDNIRDNELGGTLGNLSASAQKLTSKIDKVENGPLKLAAPTDTDATVPRNQVVSIVKAGDSSVTNPVSYHPQKKRAFHMSAHEDYLELDDDAYPNGAVSYHPQKKRAFHLSAHEDYLELDDDAYPNGAVPYHPQKKRAFHLSAHEDYLELDDDAYPNGAVPYHPQKKRAFHLSAHEDYLELDDDAYPNGAVPSFSTWKETTGSTPVAEKTTSATETDVQEIPPASSVVLPSKSFTTDGSPPVRSADGSTFGQKFDIPTSISSSIPDPTFKPTMGAVSVAAHTILGSEKFNSQNGSVVNPPLLNFGNKVVQSTEVTAADAPSKESTKSGPIFGLDKVASSKEPGADAPLFNFGINENVDYVPQFAFSSPVGGLNFGVFSDSKMTSSIKLVSTTVPVAVDSMPKGINKNVDYVPQFAFSSPVGGLNFGVFSDSKMTSSIKLVSTTVPVAVDSMQKVLELMLMLRLI